MFSLSFNMSTAQRSAWRLGAEFSLSDLPERVLHQLGFTL
jgi:hypothetical protein